MKGAQVTKKTKIKITPMEIVISEIILCWPEKSIKIKMKTKKRQKEKKIKEEALIFS